MKGTLHTDELMHAITSGQTGCAPHQPRLHHGCANLSRAPLCDRWCRHTTRCDPFCSRDGDGRCSIGSAARSAFRPRRPSATRSRRWSPYGITPGNVVQQGRRDGRAQCRTAQQHKLSCARFRRHPRANRDSSGCADCPRAPGAGGAAAGWRTRPHRYIGRRCRDRAPDRHRGLAVLRDRLDFAACLDITRALSTHRSMCSVGRSVL